jgi:hypothetical protein
MKNHLVALIIGVGLGGCTVNKDFDLRWHAHDLNGFPLNPKWGSQEARNELANSEVSCPSHSDATEWTKSPQFPSCTSFPVTFDSSFLCSGFHTNFTAVTYTDATLRWREESVDDDFGIDVSRPDRALFDVAYQAVHSEFDTDETVKNWDDTGTWWERFHDATKDSDARAAAMMDGSEAIVIGLLGLDVEHHGKPELHPVYAMFVHLKERPVGLSSWAFFVRNWGNEGFCSDNDEDHRLYTPQDRMKIWIPNVAGLVSQNVHKGARNEDDLSPMNGSMAPTNNGVVLDFGLLAPDKESWWVGDFTFVARPPSSTTTTVSAPPIPVRGDRPSAGDEPENLHDPELQALFTRVGKLPAESRKELYRQLEALTPRRKSFPAKITVLFEVPHGDARKPGGPPSSPAPATGRKGGGAVARQLLLKKKAEVIKSYLAAHE